MSVENPPIEISYSMTDPDLYEMVMHSKSKLFGWSGRTMVKVFMAVIALAFAMMAFGLPTVVGMPDDDPGKVPFQIGLLGAGAILVVLYPRYARWYTRKASTAYQTLPLQMKLVIDDAGIQAQLDGQSGSTAWKLIERVVETESYIFLYLNRLRAYIIPKSALGNPVERERLRKLIAAHVVVKA
jgi:YcxB-like protein